MCLPRSRAARAEVSSYDFSGVAVNVLPINNNTTIVVFSYARMIASKVQSSLDRILTSSGDHQKYELSKLIIARMANFIVAPTHFRIWSPDKVKRLEHSFVESAVTGRDPTEHHDLMLF